ncbi:hypothetical protein [Streptomyces kronopolitis]|uniref:hypothetical protein n=1 Tax=Streptomyces kronopolitis TaxID=1612435 RepID=UPI0036CAB885
MEAAEHPGDPRVMCTGIAGDRHGGGDRRPDILLAELRARQPSCRDGLRPLHVGPKGRQASVRVRFRCLVVSEGEISGERERIQFRLVVERDHPHGAVGARIGAVHRVLGPGEAAPGGCGVSGHAVNGCLPGKTEGCEQWVAARDGETSGHIIGGHCFHGAAHVPVQRSGM